MSYYSQGQNMPQLSHISHITFLIIEFVQGCNDMCRWLYPSWVGEKMEHLPTFKANFLKAPFLDPKVGTVKYSKLFCSMLWPELLWKVDISSDLHVLIVGFTRGARMVRRDYRDECRRHKLWPSRRSFCIQKHQETGTLKKFWQLPMV